MAQLNGFVKSPLHSTSQSHPSTFPLKPSGTPRCSAETGKAEQMGYTPARTDFITLNTGSLKRHYSILYHLIQPFPLVALPDERAASHLLKCKPLTAEETVWIAPLQTPSDCCFLLNKTSSWVGPFKRTLLITEGSAVKTAAGVTETPWPESPKYIGDVGGDNNPSASSLL